MATEEEPHYLETLYGELALALGDAVWAFARIEWLTYEYLGRLSTDQIDELVPDLGFRQRTSIIRRLVHRKSADAEKRSKALAAIKEIEDLSEQRNIIVHNPWRIWIDLDAEEFMTEIQKYSNRERKVDLSSLKVFAEKCGNAEAQFVEAVNAL